MSDVSTSPKFKANAAAALADPELQKALKSVEVNFVLRRREAADRLPEFEALRDSARDIKDHTLAHLDLYLEEFERRAVARGTRVHFAVTAADARRACAAGISTETNQSRSTSCCTSAVR